LFVYIDCVRGYAVTLVITCHLAYAYVDLPYPVHRLAVQGWYGVQLFFLASALTLLMSWQYEADRLRGARVVPFFVRRFFRIAPAYYAAALFYAVLMPPVGGFDETQLALSLGFLNGWSPATMPTTPGVWNVVQGGWSVAVEVTFYLLFPLFATQMRGVRRALLVFMLCCVAGVLANLVAAPLLARGDALAPVENFLFFWFPDQMPVFALGGVLYAVRQWLEADPTPRAALLLRRHGGTVAAVALAAMFVTAYVPFPHYWGAPGWPPVPGFMVASVCLAVFILALSQARRTVLLSPLAAVVGRVSFSAYLLHYAVIALVVAAHPGLSHAHAHGVAAIAAFAVGWCVVMALTSAAAWCSYHVLERPMMAFAKSLVRVRWTLAAQLH
jgi:peptidoglycan/LPS O-acetylase OafA/YrhL